jgi:hypothetical protein
MKASQNLPGVPLTAICRDSGPVPGSGADHENLVIENLAELAAAGVSGVCGICFADYALSPASGL